jgi:hypothetical protein
MRRSLAALLSTATIAGAVGLAGCSDDADDGATRDSAVSSNSAAPSPAPAPRAAPLPPPAALTGVLSRLADASVPGQQKLNLVEGATPENAGVLDKFANALVNGGFAPAKFDVREVNWSDRDPADVVADVDVSSGSPKGPHFAFPMEFRPHQGGWQLSARTADVLLAFGGDTPEPPATPGH